MRRWKRLLDELLAILHVVEDIRSKMKNPPLMRSGTAPSLDVGDEAVVVGRDDVVAGHGLHAEEARQLCRCMK